MSSSDFKSLLNQYCQRFGVGLPKYTTTQATASKVTPVFSCSLELFNGQVFESEGSFCNKKSAEQNVAQQAVIHLSKLQSGPRKDCEQQLSVSSTLQNDVLQSTSEKQVHSEDERIDIGNSSSASLCLNVSNTSTFHSNPETSPQTAHSHSLTSTLTLSTSKTILNEHAQKLHIPMPIYETYIDPVALGFVSVVTFDGVKYKSKGAFRLKKEAEKSAALEALLFLQSQESAASNPIPQIEEQSHETCDQNTSFVGYQNPQLSSASPCSSMMPGIYSTASPQMGTIVNIQSSSPSTQVISFKNLLQEYMQQRRKGDIPKYETIVTGNGLFRSIVRFSGKYIECSQEFATKKEAEQCVAREALVSLGITDPELLATKRLGKGKQESPGRSWDPRRRKSQRLDEQYTSPEKLKLESAVFQNEAKDVNLLSVGEIWMEKGNVAIVGNSNTSFVLYCTRVNNSLELLNTRTLQNQILEPGHRLVGLDAVVSEFKGRLVLQAERCADIEVPEQADPVLISCGVVILHQEGHNSSHVEVLLKRYLVSQAFINVKATMAQFFRRAVIGHPMVLPVESLTAHIEAWKLEEVVAMATMTASSLKPVFTSMWKFKDQWSEILEPPLPKDLQELQEIALQELLHRNKNGINITDLENHPWSLPKGNFRHRMLSTGLHIENPSECAVRELREETGIDLYDADLKDAPYIDLPQNDNLNPHKGDIARYFLYMYDNPVRKEQNMGSEEWSTSEQIISNLETRVEGNQGQIVLPSSENENRDDDQKIYSQDIPAVQPDSCQQCPTDIPASSSHSGGLDDSVATHGSATTSAQTTLEQDLCISESSSSSSVNKSSPLNTEVLSNDDNDKHNQNEHPEQRGKKRKLSCNDEESTNSLKDAGSKMASPTYWSPNVKAGLHEECAWFPLEEAGHISPVFAEISETQIFMTFLKSLVENHV